MDQQERCLYLIRALMKEMPQYGDMPIPALPSRRWDLLRGLMNVRPPLPAGEEFLRVQDAYLRQMTRDKGIVDGAALPPCPGDGRIALWQGDITTLQCDAIVNAANSGLLGCFSPCHGCIDNIIHTMSGVQLRLACQRIMAAQGHEEPTGRARITPAFNLPSRFVIHTVGPVVEEEVTPAEDRLLASCYDHCLALAAAHELRSIAFCCISTGVFRFPPRRAAGIAVARVKKFLETPSSVERVIFNVFKDSDWAIYQALLAP